MDVYEIKSNICERGKLMSYLFHKNITTNQIHLSATFFEFEERDVLFHTVAREFIPEELLLTTGRGVVCNVDEKKEPRRIVVALEVLGRYNKKFISIDNLISV